MNARLSPLLSPELLTLDLRATEHEAALREVAEPLRAHPDMRDYDRFFEQVIERERLDSTYLGNSVALPHARTSHVGRVVLAVGRSAAGLRFENCESPVHLLFVLGTPTSSPGDYLRVVSTLCKILASADNRAALLSASTPAAFLAAITTAEEKLFHAKN
ncbi:hypothetical protein AXK11_06155 [Cephaloticoccus primus]|uniref:PTS EIIA type-2 domain-containing protein n=1 Tax=Cephaloticoccus primus TaxID=1548207 RepID=A0A139SLZ7_9BACT|nr:PTS sugar transporter subunit IIA [Cephaloticoccus primus]KXU35567.1 hypothetical protein AXK11_06155 [Cephaloticoccus primus]